MSALVQYYVVTGVWPSTSKPCTVVRRQTPLAYILFAHCNLSHVRNAHSLDGAAVLRLPKVALDRVIIVSVLVRKQTGKHKDLAGNARTNITQTMMVQRAFTYLSVERRPS